MSIFSLTIFIFHLALCCLSAKGEDVTLRCPKKWRNKCPTTVSCILQTTNFISSVCSVTNGFDNRTDFLFKKHGTSAPSPVCAVDFNTRCDGTFSNKGCACVSHSETSYTFYQNVVTDDSVHANGSWICEPVCFNVRDRFALTTSTDDSCSSVVILYFTLELRGIVLICVGTALVGVGLIMIIACGLGIAGKVGIVVGCVGYVLLIVGSILMTVAYVDDERAGIVFLWVGSGLLIILGIGVLITGVQQKHSEADSASKEKGTEHKQPQRHDGDQHQDSTGTQNGTDGSSPADNKKVPSLICVLNVMDKVGVGLMWFGGTLAISGGIVAADEPCPSDVFPTTLQEIQGLILAVIGSVVFVVGFIIVIVTYKKKKNQNRIIVMARVLPVPTKTGDLQTLDISTDIPLG